MATKGWNNCRARNVNKFVSKRWILKPDINDRVRLDRVTDNNLNAHSYLYVAQGKMDAFLTLP